MKGCGKLPFVLASLVLYCCSLRSQRWGSFLSDAIYEACAAKANMYSLRSYFFKSKSNTSLVDTR